MKSILLSALTALTLAACGQSNGTAALKAADSPTTPARSAIALTAVLGDVQAAAAQSPATGLWTKIELKYEVPCTEALATFNYALRDRTDGGVDLLASAIATRAAQEPGTFSCQSILLVTKTVTAPGILARDSFHLVILCGPDATLQATTKALEPIGLALDGIHSLCPQGAMCTVNGTVVRLKTTRGVSCVDKIAPVLYAVEKNADGSIKLAVSATDMVDSRVVGCALIPKTVEISLPFIFVDESGIDLTVVGGN
jgi:hypothetical protein